MDSNSEKIDRFIKKEIGISGVSVDICRRLSFIKYGPSGKKKCLLYAENYYEFLKETSHKDIKGPASEEINGEI